MQMPESITLQPQYVKSLRVDKQWHMLQMGYRCQPSLMQKPAQADRWMHQKANRRFQSKVYEKIYVPPCPLSATEAW